MGNTPVRSGGWLSTFKPQPLSCWSDTSFHTAGTFRFPAPPSNPTVCSQGNVWKWIMEISDGKLGALAFHLACPYPEAPLQPARDGAGNITLSGREAHRGASPSQGTGQSIYLPVAWACLIQAFSQVDLSPLPGAAGLQTQCRPPFFLILAKHGKPLLALLDLWSSG